LGEVTNTVFLNYLSSNKSMSSYHG